MTINAFLVALLLSSIISEFTAFDNGHLVFNIKAQLPADPHQLYHISKPLMTSVTKTLFMIHDFLSCYKQKTELSDICI